MCVCGSKYGTHADEYAQWRYTKTKTNTLTLTLTLTDTGGAVLTLMLGYRSLYITWQQHHNCRIVCKLSLRILICILPVVSNSHFGFIMRTKTHTRRHTQTPLNEVGVSNLHSYILRLCGNGRTLLPSAWEDYSLTLQNCRNL